MTPAERLKEIDEYKCEFVSRLDGPLIRVLQEDDYQWLIVRIKTLTGALEFYADISKYSPGEDWGLNHEYEEVRIETEPDVCADLGITARKALEEE